MLKAENIIAMGVAERMYASAETWVEAGNGRRTQFKTEKPTRKSWSDVGTTLKLPVVVRIFSPTTFASLNLTRVYWADWINAKRMRQLMP